MRAQQPDLILLDIRMGGEESGWTLLELLTLDPQTRPIPLIVCSAAIRDLQDHQPLLDRFGIGVLPKPFDLEVLLEKVEAALGRGKARSMTPSRVAPTLPDPSYRTSATDPERDEYRRPEGRALQIVVVTVNHESAEIAEALGTGYLPKPFNVDELLSVVWRCLVQV